MATILIAMPTQGHVHTETMKALLDLTQTFSAKGIAFSFKTTEGSDIVMSRNFLMSWFLAEEIYTHTLLLDSDMAFETDTIFRMLEIEEPFTVAAYPQKRLNLSKFREKIELEASKPVAQRTSTHDILAASLRYNVQQSLDAGAPWKSKHKNGFATVPGAGTGLMLIERSVPEKMTELGVASRLSRHDDLPLYKGARFHDFFSHMNSSDDRLMYGEDQSFCRRWVEGCEGEIWCDETAIVTHYGMFGFRGQYSTGSD